MGDSGTGGGGHRLGAVHALIAAMLAAWLVLALGCSGKPRHVRSSSPPPAHYTVKRGDTLYGISFRYNLDYRAVARWNGIGPPYRIYPGQRLHLHPRKAATPRATSPPEKPAAAARKQAPRKAQSASRRAGAAAAGPSRESPRRSAGSAASGIAWAWPTEGRLIRRFRADGPGRKGIQIAGRPGQPVRAAAAGRVVYAGSGLRGYGKLIIIKHDKIYLSAYAHNRRLLVEEGDRVRKGQKIAELGATGTDSPKLHFEIRRNGKPVDPLRYLPRR